MNRVTFLVDGFNLYHSVADAQRVNDGRTTKWLDLRSLCIDCLQPVGSHLNVKVDLERIHYFSAPPVHCSDGRQSRHELYMKCLASSGICLHLGRFKRKDVRCSLCHGNDVRHEEKETDVAIATKLFEICHSDEADSIVVVTGDTDLIPAAKTCQRLFPDKFICFSFPFMRLNKELKHSFPGSFKLKSHHYFNNQLPNPLTLHDGSVVNKPAHW